MTSCSNSSFGPSWPCGPRSPGLCHLKPKWLKLMSGEDDRGQEGDLIPVWEKKTLSPGFVAVHIRASLSALPVGWRTAAKTFSKEPEAGNNCNIWAAHLELRQTDKEKLNVTEGRKAALRAVFTRWRMRTRGTETDFEAKRRRGPSVLV